MSENGSRSYFMVDFQNSLIVRKNNFKKVSSEKAHIIHFVHFSLELRDLIDLQNQKAYDFNILT